MMKKYFYLLALPMVAVLSFTSCSDDDDTPSGPQYDTVTFEGTYWDALIDTVESGGKMLYGSDPFGGFTEDETVYNWTDATTQLHSEINAGQYGTAFYSGGAAVSNWRADIADGDYLTQLSIPTGLDAVSGSNFLIVTGYADETYGDTRATFTFADGKVRQIEGLWLTNTSYFLNEMKNGAYTAAATADTYVDVVFYAYDAAGTLTGSVKSRLQAGVESLMAWRYVDLSSLGKVYTLRVGFEASADQYGQYGLNTPAYVAFDNICIAR